MLMVVVNADGLATEEPWFTVVVAFSVARTEPVELMLAASENSAVSRARVNGIFMAAVLAIKCVNWSYDTSHPLPYNNIYERDMIRMVGLQVLPL